MGLSVATSIATPLRSGSVSDALIITQIIVGFAGMSSDRSLMAKCNPVSNCVPDGIATSPDLRKLKKDRVQAAQSILLNA